MHVQGVGTVGGRKYGGVMEGRSGTKASEMQTQAEESVRIVGTRSLGTQGIKVQTFIALSVKQTACRVPCSFGHFAIPVPDTFLVRP